METASLSPAARVLPGWGNRALLDRLIEAHRPPLVSLRSISATLALVGACVAFALAGWVALRYAALVEDCNAAAARYPDATLYCEATPSLSSSGYDPHEECQHYRYESTLDVCFRQSALHPSTILSLAVVGVGFAVVALLLAGWWWLARRSFPPFVDVLRARAREVCWVYVRTTNYVDSYSKRHRGASTVVVLALASRQTVEIGATSVSEAEELARWVALLVPWATTGHSAMAEAAFGRDPRSLYRA